MNIRDLTNIGPWNAPRTKSGPRVPALDALRAPEERAYLERVRANKAKAAKAAREAGRAPEAARLRAHNDSVKARRLAEECRELGLSESDLMRMSEDAAAARERGKRYALLRCKATPGWANESAMKAIYFEAAKREFVAGVSHDVDHIVPLQSKVVCGLHCEQNLQVLTKYQNLVKGNRWWPDMP